MISIAVQNLVRIDAVASKTLKFQYLARMAEKCLFTPQVWGFGAIRPSNGVQYGRNPKVTPLRESASFVPSSVKIHRPV